MTGRLENTEFRCEKCHLERVDCCCSFPEMVEGKRCGRCGTWKPLRRLEEVPKEGGVKYDACRSCHAQIVDTSTDHSGTGTEPAESVDGDSE